jgi:hypothetical protein
MKVYRGTELPKIIKPLNGNDDHGKIITNGENEGKHRPTKDEKRDDTIKELIAEDVLTLGAREASLIHGVGIKTAQAYSNGKQMGEDSKAKVLNQRHEIENLAVTKLMQTLELLDPDNVEKERDRVTIMTGLSKVLDSITEKKKDTGSQVLHLHLYDPGRKSEKDYDVIDVG